MPIIDAVEIALPGPAGPPGSGFPVPVGRYLGPLTHGPGASATSATRTLTANVAFITPFVIPVPMTIDRLAVNVNTVGATTNLRLGLYATGADGKPGAQVSGAGVATTAVAAGIVQGTVTTGQLPAGVYWFLIHSDAAHAISSGTAVLGVLGQSAPNLMIRSAEYQLARAYGSLPATLTGATLTEDTSTSAYFLGWIRRAS